MQHRAGYRNVWIGMGLSALRVSAAVLVRVAEFIPNPEPSLTLAPAGV